MNTKQALKCSVRPFKIKSVTYVLTYKTNNFVSLLEEIPGLRQGQYYSSLSFLSKLKAWYLWPILVALTVALVRRIWRPINHDARMSGFHVFLQHRFAQKIYKVVIEEIPFC